MKIDQFIFETLWYSKYTLLFFVFSYLLLWDGFLGLFIPALTKKERNWFYRIYYMWLRKKYLKHQILLVMYNITNRTGYGIIEIQKGNGVLINNSRWGLDESIENLNIDRNNNDLVKKSDIQHIRFSRSYIKYSTYIKLIRTIKTEFNVKNTSGDNDQYPFLFSKNYSSSIFHKFFVKKILFSEKFNNEDLYLLIQELEDDGFIRKTENQSINSFEKECHAYELTDLGVEKIKMKQLKDDDNLVFEIINNIKETLG